VPNVPLVTVSGKPPPPEPITLTQPVLLSPTGNYLLLTRPKAGLRRFGAPAPIDLLIWDVQQGRTTAALTQREALAVSPDGRHLVTAGDGRLARGEGGEELLVTVWELTTGQELRTIRGHPGNPLCAAFGPDGRSFAVSYSDGSVKVWEAATGKELATMQGHQGAVRGVAFSPDGRELATAGTDRTVRLWNAATGQHQHTLPGHTGPVESVAFHPKEPRLVSGDQEKAVKLWNLDTHQEVLTLSWDHVPTQLVFSPDGSRLAGTNPVGVVQSWDGTPHSDDNPGSAGSSR
jgi:WD40 repeat protein